MTSTPDPAPEPDPTPAADPHQHAVETVEALVRRQMAASLGGTMGMIEAGIPGLAFTICWLLTKDIRLSLILGGVSALAFLINRLVRRETLKYVGNAIFSMAIGWVFIKWAASQGGDEQQQALAFFLPGILWSAGYTVMLAISCLTRWPMMGFLLGGDPEDPFAWRRDRQIVDLCVKLTWVFAIPGAVGVLLQGPIWLMGNSGAMKAGAAVALIAVLRLVLGWILRIGSWAAMFWLLARDATPVDPSARPAAGPGAADPV